MNTRIPIYILQMEPIVLILVIISNISNYLFNCYVIFNFNDMLYYDIGKYEMLNLSIQ